MRIGKVLAVATLTMAASMGSVPAATEITAADDVALFHKLVVDSGYTCARVVSVLRLDYLEPKGRPFMVACSGGLQFMYRVIVQQRGTATVEPWKD